VVSSNHALASETLLPQNRERKSSEVLGLYIHVPFCSAICHYCNFNRGLFDAELKKRYVAALVREITDTADGASADTIFFGGGTPSLLDAEDVFAVIDACKRGWTMSADPEITLEANPETVTPERLAGFRGAGINRLSLGVQSFRDDELGRLGRMHSADRAIEAFHTARAQGFGNISVDLMMWLPEQTIADWLESVNRLIALGPEHASLYMLEIYPNAPLRDVMARGQWSVAPDDDAADMYLSGLDRMDAAGYIQYEISNTALAGRHSRHNWKYWADGEWLGFGCGAHSTRGGTRWKNISATSEYVSVVMSGGSPATEVRVLPPRERLEDALFTGLRLSAGLDLNVVNERYRVDVWNRYGPELEPFVDRGFVVYDGRTLRLSRAGMLLAHEIMTVFIH
jgi:oxygen-independent coproporphyrinogen-3 oxidase